LVRILTATTGERVCAPTISYPPLAVDRTDHRPADSLEFHQKQTVGFDNQQIDLVAADFKVSKEIGGNGGCVQFIA